MRSWLAVCVVFGLVPLNARAESPTAAAATAITAEQLAGWISALSAREFEARDAATQALISAGKPAIDAVFQVSKERDREVATRAVVILRGIGETGDLDTLESALDKLGQIAAQKTGELARHASESQERLGSVRQERAIEYFRARGAKVMREYSDPWLLPSHEDLFAVEIGPEWKGTGADLARLGWLRDVEHITLIGPQVTDDWLTHLAAMPQLASVKLKRTSSVTVKGVETVTMLSRVYLLRLLYVSVGDDAVPVLEKRDRFARLMFISRTLSADGVNRLKARFNDRVDCPKGGLLGIQSGIEEPWYVNSVAPGSAAEKAGIRPNDRIAKYNGVAITTFASLKAEISKNEGGDSVDIEIQRGNETLAMKVTLGEWD